MRRISGNPNSKSLPGAFAHGLALFSGMFLGLMALPVVWDIYRVGKNWLLWEPGQDEDFQ